MKEELARSVSGILEPSGFTRKRGKLSWSRKVNDVIQVVLAEKMRGDNVRLKVLIAHKTLGVLGGNLMGRLIQGGGDLGQGDYYWGIGDSASFESSADEITSILSQVCLPWFTAINDGQSLESGITDYKGSNISLNLSDYIDEIDGPGAFEKSSYEILHWEGLRNYLSESVGEELLKSGFDLEPDDFRWIRARGEVVDVVEVIPVNFGLHFGCFVYSWLPEFSSDGTGMFNSDSRIVFVGGAIKGPDGQARLYRVHCAKERSISSASIAHDVLENVSLIEMIKTRAEFIAAVPEIHRPALSAFGVTNN